MRILVQDPNGVRELEEGYASEAELQAFLRDHSELVPMDEIDLGTPPLLCVGWEVHVASGSEDLLYIDETGLLTIVETKLKKNREARREVLGQILEYAAHAVEWSASDIIARAEKFLNSQGCPEYYRGSSLEAALTRFLENTHPPIASTFSFGDFLREVSAKLQRGNIRLIIAVDEPPPSLLRTVEFVNRFSQHFEVFLFQLTRFHDKATEANVFVPRLFGRVAKPEEQKTARLWDKEQFLAQASEQAPEALAVLRRLVEFAENEGLVRWGRGAKFATVKLAFAARDGIEISAYWLMANGKIEIGFWKWPDALRAAKEAYREVLRTVEGIPMDAVETETWKDIDVGFLASDLAWSQFQNAVRVLKRALAAADAQP